MELYNLLSGAEIWLYGTTYNINLNWIGELIRLLITGVGSVGVGVILFSVILKVIVLPFDVYQRITMRKQNIKMKENKEKMAKLQKQYANDKEKYNQKLMEMYKESGISPCSSCLPMILSMVIFIVAINAFNAYSQYANVKNYNDMVHAYNTKLESYCADLTPTKEDGVIVVEVANNEDSRLRISDNAEGKYIYYEVSKPANFDINNIDYTKISAAEKYFYVDIEKVYNSGDTAMINAINALKDANTTETDENKKTAKAVSDYFISLAQQEVLQTYKDEIYYNSSFLWIKNIWETDASYKTPIVVYKDFEAQAKTQKFNVEGKEVSYGKIGNYTGANNPYESNAYNYVTGALKEQKSAPNGYFILIVLSIGTILLQQIITMRSQKEQQQFSTVDGEGAAQQKTMLVVMTVMFAVFSFMYSSAFSIYMIMSNVLSLGSTLIINKIVDVVMRKREEKAFLEKHQRVAKKPVETPKKKSK